MLGMPTDLMLAKHEVTVCLDVENAAAAGNEFE